MKTSFIFLLICLSFQVAASIRIEDHPVFNSMLVAFRNQQAGPEIYPLSEKYRLDLTLSDLIDQSALIAEDYAGYNDRLKKALYSHDSNINFLSWFNELKKIAEENKDFKEALNQKLYLQFYSPRGIALIPDYKFVDLKKIKDNGKLSRIGRYNNFVNDPEGQGLLMSFELQPSNFYYTKSLTVTKLHKIKQKTIKKLRKSYYQNLINLYSQADPQVSFSYSDKGLKAFSNGRLDKISIRLFHVVHQLPNKHQLLFYLSTEVQGMPYESGFFILTPSFIKANFKEIEEALKEYTLSQILFSHDDRYLLSIRNFIEDKAIEIESKISSYNSDHQTNLKLVYLNREKKPKRLEAMLNQEMLLTLYPTAPWFKRHYGSLINNKGKEVFFPKSIGQALANTFNKLGRDIIQTENYLSLLAGATTLVLTKGNVPLMMSTKKIIKNAIEYVRYDQEIEEFLKEVPKEVLDSILLSSGVGAGRLYKVVALGAGQGFLQSFFTGQDLKTGAAVGAGLNLLQFYVIPSSIARPMTDGVDAKSLAMNRKLEILEKTIRASVQGTVVAALTSEDMLRGALKGSIYGLVSTPVLIWFVGTRYNPFKEYDQSKIDEVINLENDFQNEVGRGGTYAIDRQLILDANYRMNGVLPNVISASITLPGNVSMGRSGYNKLTTMVHEAHHLMQQHQSGVFGFYLFRYLPTALRTGYNGHPDENFLRTLIGDF